jgi:hypothetical protein
VTPAEEPVDTSGPEASRLGDARRLGLGREGLLDDGQRRPQQPEVRGRGRAGLSPPAHGRDRGLDKVGVRDDLVEQADGQSVLGVDPGDSRTSRMALAPASRGSSTLDALEMVSPRWFSGRKYSAAGVPIRASKHNVISHAPPTAIPLTAAMTGTRVCSAARVMS